MARENRKARFVPLLTSNCVSRVLAGRAAERLGVREEELALEEVWEKRPGAADEADEPEGGWVRSKQVHVLVREK